MKALGICIGASTISTVQLESADPGEPPRVTAHSTHPHDGDPRRTLISVLSGLDFGEVARFAATGRRFRHHVNLSQISETEAVELAYRFSRPPGVECPAVVSAGGETFMTYVLSHGGGQGRVTNVITGNKCASGTGEFFLQQLRRMDVSLEDVPHLADTDQAYRLSGRCSVFCKSDCTHATNKGIPVGRVTAGLCRMMANKILELLKNIERRDIMITGGTVRNPIMIRYLADLIPGLVVPESAPWFEALGAALWALDHETQPFPGLDDLILPDAATFETLPPLHRFESMVTFKTMARDTVRPGDECILGLDVGSTTTKAVLMRRSDNAMLADIYLKTNGQPVEASRKCYRSILDQVRAVTDPAGITVTGLGVCGSGRQIAGLHALTDGIINEIIAHAAAAVHFDPEVDTLFEIGGQDAKYTYITNGVPSDYAMNEACSAGTGSFLEESAHETLGITMEAIADIALKGERPPNFNDQCAAFIASDINTAIHDGVRQADVVAGLVYSIGMNYANRVKGNRPVGEKVFMQGGVCYNRAVPLGMAALVGKPIIVPPEPGLMGAFGVALEVAARMEAGLLPEDRFDLAELADREVRYGRSFICKGGREKCDRRCEIALIELAGKKFPFGGACNRYYNLRHRIAHDMTALDGVAARQRTIFEPVDDLPAAEVRGRVGFNRSFLVNTYYPLYAAFFTALGYPPILPDVPSEAGIDQRDAPFCYPAELSHGFFHTLLGTDPPPDFIFLPHFKAVPSLNGIPHAQVCPIVQGETFFLRTTFRESLDALSEKGGRLLTPLLDLTKGVGAARAALVTMAVEEMGIGRETADAAFTAALGVYEERMRRIEAAGRRAIEDLEADPDRIGVVVFARPYNGFAEEAHMGIPRKLASRGVTVLPMDCLPFEGEALKGNMYWGMGQIILMAARFVQRHPQLFGLYVTNFSCGPDSFIIGYFRQIMGRKPALTLELDSHTADAGLETRIEAFLDVVNAYRSQVLGTGAAAAEPSRPPEMARIVSENGRPRVRISDGRTLDMDDPRVTFLLPSMGRYSSEALAAVFRASGFNASALPPADKTALALGRANTSCKECLPLLLTTGSLLDYIDNRRQPGEVVVYFMATASGPCRFGQYLTFIGNLIQRREIPDVALFTLSGENSYAGMGGDFDRRGWWAVVISDVIEDIRSMLMTAARDRDEAVALLETQWLAILFELEYGSFKSIEAQLARTAERLAAIPLRTPADDVPRICLTGEIFVRRDDLSRQNLTTVLADRGFAAVCSPVAEWVHYCDFLNERNLAQSPPLTNLGAKLAAYLKGRFTGKTERRIKSILARSGLVHDDPIDVRSIIDGAFPDINPNLTCETILTVGAALTEIVSHACGVIAIGPFGCMPNRLSEAILTRTMVRDRRLRIDPTDETVRAALTQIEDLPFLAIESDGSPFPQLINAKLETFLLRAERLHREMEAARASA